MTQEEKQLLLVDLSARVPYEVKCRYQHIQYVENGKIIYINMVGIVNINGHIKDICDVKPYLYPLSSMTEEQKDVYHSFYADILRGLITSANSVKMIDWLNKNHFDFRNLIGRGLAIDCTNLNIY